MPAVFVELESRPDWHECAGYEHRAGLVGGTEFSQVRLHGDAERAAKVYEGTEPLTSEDIAEAVAWAVTLPEHAEHEPDRLMPTCQGPGTFIMKRQQSSQ